MSVDEIVGRLKDRGLRITPQRVEIVKLLLGMSHPTADQIYARMHEAYPYVSHATIYNTLKVLKEAGIVSELANGQRAHYYEVAGRRHCHFSCKGCGGIFDMEEGEAGEISATAELPKLSGGFRIEECRIELAGLCPECLLASPATGG